MGTLGLIKANFWSMSEKELAELRNSSTLRRRHMTMHTNHIFGETK
jgi:hypothetical protein